MGKQIDEVMEQLNKGVEGVFESEKYKKFMETMAKFHKYSLNNSLLISMQKPDASQVASYTAWKDKFHRQVKQGEKGITIIAPSSKKETVEIIQKGPDGQPILDFQGQPIIEKREVEHRGFRVATVFDISQTEGEPLPELVSELTDPVKGFDDYLDAVKDLSPVPVRFGQIDSGAKGYYSARKQEIVVQRGMSEEQTLKTLLHEVAHARLGHGGTGDKLDRQTREVQAESVAYCCCRSIGLDTSDYSFGYIAGWSSGKAQKELKASLQTIRNESDRMISGIEDSLKLSMKIREERAAMETPKVSSDGMKIAL